MLGDRIKELRLSRGYSQKDLAKIFKVAQSTVSAWERGKRSPDDNTKINIARFFDVPMDYLLPKDLSSDVNFNFACSKEDPIYRLIRELAPRSLTDKDVDLLIALYNACEQHM